MTPFADYLVAWIEGPPTSSRRCQSRVPQTRGGPSIHPTKSKGSNRTLSLDPATVAALEAHREAQLTQRDLAGEAYTDLDLIFCNELGAMIQPERLTERFQEVLKAAGIRPGRLHDVRHSTAWTIPQ